MPATRVRIDYETLQQAAQAFARQAAAARQLLGQIQHQQEVLERGDWAGQGAAAFYREMHQVVLPALKRLGEALDQAQATTAQINQLMQQAEAEAARVLRVDGAGGAGRAAGPVSAGMQGFVNFGVAQVGGGGGDVNLFDPEQVAGWKAQAEKNQPALDAAMQRQAAQEAREQAEVLERIRQHLQFDGSQADPFPHLEGDEYDRAMDALKARDRFLAQHPNYNVTFAAINTLRDNARLAIDNQHRLYLAFGDSEKLQEVMKETYGARLSEQIGKAATEAVRDKLLETALTRDFGKEMAATIMEPISVGMMAFQVMEVLQDVSNERLVGEMTPEARAWQEVQKRKLVLDAMANSTGQDRAELALTYHEFDKINDDYVRYQFQEERAKHPGEKPHATIHKPTF